MLARTALLVTLSLTAFFRPAPSAPATGPWIARDDYLEVELGQPIPDVPFAGNDEPNGQTAQTVQVVVQARQGSANVDDLTGILSYANSNSLGQCYTFDEFTYRVEYAPGVFSNEATVRVLVLPPQNPPNPDCNGNCQDDQFEQDCDFDGVPDTCQSVPDREIGRTAYASIADGALSDSIGPRTRPALSDDGRWLVLATLRKLDPVLDTDALWDVYRVDLESGQAVLVSVSASGTASANADCLDPSVSEDGTFVAFSSAATNLVTPDANPGADVFVRDLVAGTTELVSLHDDDTQRTGDHLRPSITDDGRRVAFDSPAALVANDTNGLRDVYLRDRVDGTTERLSLRTDGGQADGDSYAPSINARGRYTAFVSEATNLVDGDTNLFPDVFLYSRADDRVVRVSVSSAGAEGDAASLHPSLDGTGSTVAFQSNASNLVAPSPVATPQIYLARVTGDWTTGALSVATTLESRGGSGPGDAGSFLPALTPDGTRLAFESDAGNLVPGDLCGRRDAFLRSLAPGLNRRVSLDSFSVDPFQPSTWTAVAGDGFRVAFLNSGFLVNAPSGTNHVFLYDLNRALSTASGTGWVRVADAPELDLDELTIEAWVRLDDTAGAQTIVSKWGTNGVNERSYLVQVRPGGPVRFALARDDNQTDGSFQAFDAGQLTAGEWHHVACTFDGSFRRIFVDGELVGERATAGPVHAGTADLALGVELADNGGTTANPLAGRIDEVRLWSRARSQLEIRTRINTRFDAQAMAASWGLVAAWGCEGHASDLVGLHDGTLEGAASWMLVEDVPYLEFDCNGDGLLDDWQSAVDPALDANRNGLLDACELAPSFCDASDGALASCPCANPGLPDAGCDNAQGTGGVALDVSALDLGAHTAVLTGSGFPPSGTPTAIVIRANDRAASPVVFFDGLRCIGLAGFVRLAATVASGGASTHTLLHGAGPGSFHYQLWYRNTPISYCVATAAANVSNGRTIAW